MLALFRLFTAPVQEWLRMDPVAREVRLARKRQVRQIKEAMDEEVKLIMRSYWKYVNMLVEHDFETGTVMVIDGSPLGGVIASTQIPEGCEWPIIRSRITQMKSEIASHALKQKSIVEIYQKSLQ